MASKFFVDRNSIRFSGDESREKLTLLFKNKAVLREGNDSNLLIVFYVQIMPDDFVMQLHRF